MSRFKRCEVQGCTGIARHILRFSSWQTRTRIGAGKPAKLKVCHTCWVDYDKGNVVRNKLDHNETSPIDSPLYFEKVRILRDAKM